MLRKLMVVAALALLPAAVAQGSSRLVIGSCARAATARTVRTSTAPTFGVTGDLGYFLSKEFEVSLRQYGAYNDIGVEGGNLAFGTTIGVGLPLRPGPLAAVHRRRTSVTATAT